MECGKEEKIFRNGLCVNCYIKNSSFSNGPQAIDVYMCPKCFAYKYKNTWLAEPFESVLKRFIRDSFQINNELKKVNIELDCDEKDKNIDCKVVISGFLEDNEISEEHFLEVRINGTMCDVCSKRFGGYHEAVLQIRADKRKPTKDELDNIRSNVEGVVERLRAKGNRGLFIADIGEERGGLDFYLSEKGSAFSIAKKIQEQYGGTIKQSSKNVGMKDGRQVYRMTYLIRLPAYRKGDFISYNNLFYYISSIKGNKVHVFELSNWTERVFDEKELQKASILGGKELVKEMILVSQSKNEIQVMEPETYKTIELKNTLGISFDSKTVKIVKIDDKLFLFLKKFHN